MQTDPDNSTPRPTAPQSRDAAGWALTAVTLAVLAVGVFVIRGVTERDAAPTTSGAVSSVPGEGFGPDRAVDPPEQPIVVHPIASEPTPLPPPRAESPRDSIGQEGAPRDDRFGAAIQSDRR